MIYKVPFQNQTSIVLKMTLTLYFLPKNLVQLTPSLTMVLVQWLQSNKLSLNETKTELIIFGSHWKHLPREPDIRINNYKLKLHSLIKYLGILIDKVLSWTKQIDDICTKLTRANGILSKLSHFVPKKTCVSVMYVIIECGFTLKRVRDMIRTCSQMHRTDKY